VKVGRWIVLALVVGGAAVYGARRFEKARSSEITRRDEAQPERLAPPGVRIKVEVLNATATRGLARRATMFLRDRGFDVVASGTYREQRGETLVIDRSNHPEWARLVARAMSARIESHPDSSRYLDVTVLIGANWRPPGKPFYP
jgi:hypothetical protein